MTSGKTGFGSLVASFEESSTRGFAAEIVVASRPGISAGRGGSFIRLPPPPPPPPGPVASSQTIRAIPWSEDFGVDTGNRASW
jgi:hypothetical protein